MGGFSTDSQAGVGRALRSGAYGGDESRTTRLVGSLETTMCPLSLVPVLVASLLASPGVNPALAHGDHHAPPTMRGTIISLTQDGFRLQTGLGLIPVAVTSQTQVLRIVSGSLADLRDGERASLDLAPGGRTVTVVHLGAPVRMTDTDHHRGSNSLTYQGNHGPAVVRQVQGQIVTMGRHTVRMRCPHAPVAGYRFSGSVQVVKQMPSSRLQLAVGESVEVMWDRASVAGAVVIWGA